MAVPVRSRLRVRRMSGCELQQPGIFVFRHRFAVRHMKGGRGYRASDGRETRRTHNLTNNVFHREQPIDSHETGKTFYRNSRHDPPFRGDCGSKSARNARASRQTDHGNIPPRKRRVHHAPHRGGGARGPLRNIRRRTEDSVTPHPARTVRGGLLHAVPCRRLSRSRPHPRGGPSPEGPFVGEDLRLRQLCGARGDRWYRRK